MEAEVLQLARGKLLKLVVVGMVLAVAAAWLVVYLDGGAGRTVGAHRISEPSDLARTSGVDRGEIASALERGVRRAAMLNGSVEAAAMAASWAAPVVAASPVSGSERKMRMWSMSKVVTMVALLRSLGWGSERGDPPSPEVRQALDSAIVRSENCPQRRIVLELQRLNGNSVGGAREAVAATLKAAGAEGEMATQVAGPEASCLPFLEAQREIPDPLAPTVLLGTSTWRVGDAARFMDAVGSGIFGKAVADRVLSEMRIPKEPSTEISPSEYTAAPDWGAGRALAPVHPAYKAGWGGTQQGEFMVGQIAFINLPGWGQVGIAAVFHPDAQPAADDPGLTNGPAAIERVMKAIVQRPMPGDRLSPR
jgi:hypothetical protein